MAMRVLGRRDLLGRERTEIASAGSPALLTAVARLLAPHAVRSSSTNLAAAADRSRRDAIFHGR
jgi:hypothetical protein